MRVCGEYRGLQPARAVSRAFAFARVSAEDARVQFLLKRLGWSRGGSPCLVCRGWRAGRGVV